MKHKILILFLSFIVIGNQNSYSQTTNYEITVADCVGSEGGLGTLDKEIRKEQDDKVKQLIEAAAKKAAKKVATTSIKAMAKSIAKKQYLKDGYSEKDAEQLAENVGKKAEKSAEDAADAAEDAAESAGDAIEDIAGDGFEAVAEGAADAVAEMGLEVAVELATDPTPIGAAIAIGTMVTQAIWESFKHNAYGKPKTIYIDTEKAKKPGGYRLHVGEHIIVVATEKAYDQPRIILHSRNKKSWWKGIVKFDRRDTSKWEEVVCTSGGKIVSANYITDELLNQKNYHVTLSAAKSFGVHTNMYAIRNFPLLGKDHDWHFFYF